MCAIHDSKSYKKLFLKGMFVMRIVFNLYPDAKTKALTMSYDDGVASDRRLVEIFNKNGIKGTFHLNSSKLFGDGHIGINEIDKVYNGHEVSCHTLTHPFPNTMPRESLINEIYEDRKKLEEKAGYPVRGLSYPFGEYNQTVIDQFRALGIVYSRTTKSTNNYGVPEDFMQWHPTCHHSGDILKKLEYFKNPPKRVPNLMLFYIWGHSYEFNDNNNWELIEEFCEKAAGMEDVYYATNIEIYDYIVALRNLVFSVDCTIVYNPSGIPVWFTADGKKVKVEPNQTLKII